MLLTSLRCKATTGVVAGVRDASFSKPANQHITHSPTYSWQKESKSRRDIGVWSRSLQSYFLQQGLVLRKERYSSLIIYKLNASSFLYTTKNILSTTIFTTWGVHNFQHTHPSTPNPTTKPGNNQHSLPHLLLLYYKCNLKQPHSEAGTLSHHPSPI